MRGIKASDWDYSFDDFDGFRDLSHLARMAVGKIETRIAGSRAFFFVHNLSLCEYREEDKEGSFSLAEDNPLITYLALQNRILDRKNLSEDAFFRDDSINSFLIIEQLGITTILPLVYRFQLLGFLGIRLPGKRTRLEKAERDFLNNLGRELLQNLYAALLIDRRFSELVLLSDLGKEVSAIEELPELYESLFEKLGRLLSFSEGALWLTDETLPDGMAALSIASAHGLSDDQQAQKLTGGESVSGYVFQAGKPLLVKELQRNSFFHDRNQESWLRGSLIALPLKASDRKLGVLTLHHAGRGREFTGENLHLLSVFANFTAATISSVQLTRKLEKGYFDTITALVAALDAKDPYSAGHSERVMEYAVGIAEEMQLPRDRIRLVRFAAILHDIGKIGIKGDIIRKQSRLTDEEYQVIRRHPEIGEQIISAIDFLREAKVYIKYHHERFDGEGYYHKEGKDVPREALILNLADSFDAMTTDRPYRKGFSFEEAIRRMRPEIGKQFDPESFAAFLRFLVRTGRLPASPDV